MRRAILLLIPLAAACGRTERNESTGPLPAEPVQTADLTGLYQSADGAANARMCMLSGPAGHAEFGIVTEGPSGNCGGAGEAVREGAVLRLTMGGDEPCLIEARLEGAQAIFPATVPTGCAYYCAPGASLAGMMVEKVGGTAEDARRATDLAGDPLCG